MSAGTDLAKLTPPLLDRTLRRPRVEACIASALAEGGCCWLAAPAGYGKTTAAVDFIRDQATPAVWCRIDEGDQDIASFLHYLTLLVPASRRAGQATFGPEHAEHPQAFARRFFRGWFAALPAGAVVVLDDLHDADTPTFHVLLKLLLEERPGSVRCMFLSRTFPPRELDRLRLAGQVRLLDQDVLQFTEAEARALMDERRPDGGGKLPVDLARGWAAGLVLLAEGGMAASVSGPTARPDDASVGEAALFDVLGRQVFEVLPGPEQDILLRLSLLPEITAALAASMIGSAAADPLLERLHQRQLLVTRSDDLDRPVFRLHDLLRDFLVRRLDSSLTPDEQANLRLRAATVLAQDGRVEDAIELTLHAGAWTAARGMIIGAAEALLAQGRRATVLGWCGRIPDAERDAWLCYWQGVAHIPDDEAAETWLDRAWTLFEAQRDLRGQHLAVARAVLVKTDSWRTHTGLAVWTGRAVALLDAPLPDLPPDDRLLVLVGLLRALDFSDGPHIAAAHPAGVVRELMERLASRTAPANLRLLASLAVIEHAGSMGRPALFAQAVDVVAGDLADPAVSPWVLGLWLVAFGAVSGRYFPYQRRGFPYADAEEALRTAIAIGEREQLPGVEFGGLYHLQYQMKLRNDWAELAALVGRLGQVTDSRYTTQVAVLADCEAALHTRNGAASEALAACERFMAAIEAADEPPVERWPHYITAFQARLAADDPAGAAAGLRAVAPMFEGAMRDRIEAAIAVTEALTARPAGAAYPERLSEALGTLRRSDWTAVLANLPDRLAGLVGDGLERGLEPEFCRRLVRQRRLAPPSQRPEAWPWALKIHVLGGLRLELDGAPLALGAKPPARSLDILRVLAITNGHTVALTDLHDWFWPETEGDLAKAACEQALHRLRKLLGGGDLVVQRQGRLSLAMDSVWIDLDAWEPRLAAAAPLAELDRLLDDFPGALLAGDLAGDWSSRPAERLRRAVLDLALRVAQRHEAAGDPLRARSACLRALETYPDAARLHEALIQGRVARDDMVGAWEDFARWEKARPVDDGEDLSPALRALIRRGGPRGPVA